MCFQVIHVEKTWTSASLGLVSPEWDVTIRLAPSSVESALKDTEEMGKYAHVSAG